MRWFWSPPKLRLTTWLARGELRQLAMNCAAMFACVSLGSVSHAAPPESVPSPFMDDPSPKELKHDEIFESSGVAVSRRHPDQLWTHNDSGDKPRLFAFDMQGNFRGTSVWQNAEAVDWEDMGSFIDHERPFLFAADVGDNRQDRKDCCIYVAPEPADPNTPTRAERIPFQYATGPCDCEAVAFNPVDRTFLLIEKKIGLQSRVFAIPLPEARPSRPVIAQQIGSLPIALVTSMDLSADGNRLIIATYGHGFELTKLPEETWGDAMQRAPQPVKLPGRRQGEAICYSQDSNSIYLTSEKQPTPLFCLRRQNGVAPLGQRP